MELVTLTLNHGSCVICTATTPEQVAASVAAWEPHLIILDMALDGLPIMQRLRSKAVVGSHVLVIGLVSRGNLRSKLAAFDAGVDDALSVPFAPEELLAGVVALTRRFGTPSIAPTPAIRVGGLEIDLLNHTARSGDSELRLSPGTGVVVPARSQPRPGAHARESSTHSGAGTL